MNDRPIGIFDSGVGGLTIARRIAEVLPAESFIYLGDTARVPYGSRGHQTISRMALELVDFLLSLDVKVLVVACNTISAVCLDAIEARSPVPVIGVITPSAKFIARTTRTGIVGVIGTRATIASGKYQDEIGKLDPTIHVLSQPCPLFVPVVEEDMADSPVARLLAKEYLSVFAGSGIDTLHLGCTHYPLLRQVIKETLGTSISIVDSAKPVVQELRRVLMNNDLVSPHQSSWHRFYVTDAPGHVAHIASRLFGDLLSNSIDRVELGTLAAVTK